MRRALTVLAAGCMLAISGPADAGSTIHAGLGDTIPGTDTEYFKSGWFVLACHARSITVAAREEGALMTVRLREGDEVALPPGDRGSKKSFMLDILDGCTGEFSIHEYPA